MTDVASLVIKTDTSQVKTASTDLHKLSQASGKAQSSSQGLTTAFISMRGVLATLGIGMSIGQLTKIADSYTKITAQLKLATKNQLEFNEAYKNVQRIASGSQSSIEETSVLYSRLSTSLQALNASQTQVSNITEAVALGLKISGASAAESAAAMLQLSQAFGAGALTGDEFRSVNESAPRIMQALAESIGVTRGELKQMAGDGKLTSDVIGNALLKSLDKFRKEAEKTKNISGGIQGVSNEFTLMVGEIDKATGASNLLAQALAGIAQGIKDLRQGNGGWLENVIQSLPVAGSVYRAYDLMKPDERLPQNGQSGMIKKATEGGLLKPQPKVEVESEEDRKARLRELERQNKELQRLRKEAADKANAEEVRRLNVAIWVNEQIALEEKKKNDEIAMYTERRMDIEQKRANENFENAQKIYRDQLEEEKRLTDESQKGFADLERAIDGFAKNSATSLADFIFGTKTSFGDMVNSMLKDIARLALQKSIFDPIAEGITGTLESSGGVGGFFKSLIPGFANGSDYIPRDMVANIHQGERILTRDENRNFSQGGGNVSVNVTVNSDGSSNVQSDASFGKQLGNAIKSVVQAELLKQKRQGGMLSA